MPTIGVQAGVREQAVEAVVIRCTCGRPQQHPESVCPNGRVEDLGKIAYWHKSLWKRLCWKLCTLLQKVSH